MLFNQEFFAGGNIMRQLPSFQIDERIPQSEFP